VLRPGGLLFGFEPCSLRARREGHLPVAGHEHEFAISLDWLAGRVRDAGFRIDELATALLSLRALELVAAKPSLRLLRAADTVDRGLKLVPGLGMLGKAGMLRATKTT
jgi:hypothetical protein